MHRMQDKIVSFWMSLEDTTSANARRSLIGIMLCGFLLRFYSLYAGQAYTFFAINDEITALRYALGLLAGDPQMYYLGSPALNQGHIPGPLWSLLVAILYVAGGHSAEAAVFGMIVLNTLAIYLVYRLARALLPNHYALLSTLLYAFSPWAIYYAGGLYNPIPLSLLGALLYLSLWQCLQQDNSRMIFWVCLVAAAIPQFHMIGIFYLPVILFLLYLTPRRIHWRWFVLGSVAGLAIYLPYLIGDFQHGWQNTRAMLQADRGFSFGFLKIITIPVAMLADHPGQWAGPSFDDFKVYANQYFGSYLVLTIINLLSIILSAIFIFSLLPKAWRCLRANAFHLRACYTQQPVIMFIVLVLFLPLILYALSGRGYTTRYSIMIFPLLYLLPALFLYQQPAGRVIKAVGYSLAFIFFINIYMVLSFYTEQQRRIQTSATLMPSFAQLDAIKQHVDRVLKNGEVAAFTYSEGIKKLPERQRKAYLTISEYMDAFAATRARTASAPVQRHFYVTTAAEDVAPAAGTPLVYASRAVRILRQEIAQ